MRYLLLILTFTSVCYSADAELAKILDQYDEKRMAVQRQCLADLIQYKGKNYQPMKAIIISADPKESEKKIAASVDGYNWTINRFNELSSGQGNAHHDVLYLLGKTLGDLKDMKANLIKTGVLTADTIATQDVTVVTEAPKPKEKKKITAVLADGTKIE